jgi:multicomponent Na+:H+ antiporter subunit D
MVTGLIAIPAGASIVLPFARKFAGTIFLLASTLLLLVSLSFVPASSVLRYSASDLGLPGSFELVLDGFSVLMLVLINLVGTMVGLFAFRWTKDERFYALLLLAIAGMNGLVLVTDVFTMYVFLEITSLASFALIASGKSAEGFEAAYKYLMLSAVATVFILLGIVATYGVAGGVTFKAIAGAAGVPGNENILILCLFLFTVGFAIKAGLVPFHAWVPDAYSAAPNPISVSLAGIITKAAGVYTLIRITFNVLGATPRAADILMILGLVSAAVGAFAAITQNDTKRMLAYSSVSQVGYIFLGVSTGTALGVIGGMFHLFNHAILKALLFLNASAIEKATGTRDLSRMGGLGARMPATGATFAIGSLSVAGVPPLNGFWSKLFILIALFQSGHTVVAFIALLVSIVTLGYFLVFQRKALFGKLDESLSHVREVSFGTYFPALVLAALAVFAGIFFSLVVDTLIEPAADAIMRGVIS